jgi:hypothetical protein
MGAEATWCGQCYAVRSASAPVAQHFGGASIMSPARAAAAHAAPPPMTTTRWRKTSTTFGPAGRILATLALVVPFLVFVVIGILTGGFTLAGAVIWGAVVMPWGLRDTWRAGQLPVP